ncbi:type VI secretion system baseplate subunit TssG [Chromobacterium haemolyticum]|uniref:Type VI secretion system baseplate subunit TssG n=1 Tax=Chromobacterium haemolyticum TaxID=394935 RepID=A0ABS3GSQ3_9NEIS|nr:type VI secretion system baseplate subunit TssG [Chromobacterium haemolyticum]MBK0416922.1 type VI secretion system baseplate subunit TssG [Chromobacterium haemolyticum]MBO0418080.1 type VI secretion system baseplate subunit TssG [Chromobacterium haemolyticum]MBO0501341.1 type VI secretion system baseplate subunit TssG [Chromobacterium haemolyticum]
MTETDFYTWLQSAPAYNFFQFCRVLERLPGDMRLGAADSPASDPIRLLPSPSLGFPAGEIVRAEPADPDTGCPPVLRTTFMGLYGVDAVLPYYFLDDIAVRREGHEPLAAMLDLFSHRLTALLYRAWGKYRYPQTFKAGGRDPLSKALLGLIGMGLGEAAEQRQLPAGRLLGLLALLGQRTRPASGLASVIRHALPGAGVRVREFLPSWAALDEPAPLSGRPPLRAGEFVLGRRLRAANHAIAVTVRPSHADCVPSLLPGGLLHQDVLALTRVYLGWRLEAEIWLELPASWLPASRLDPSAKPRLGLGSTLAGAAGERWRRLRIGHYQPLPDACARQPGEPG